MRIIFLGSPENVLPVLDQLYSFCQIHKEYSLSGIITQPNRPSGRGRLLQEAPLAKWAKEHNTPVYQFENINRPENLETLTNLKPDLFITAAYGQILSDAFLAIPRRGTINIHPSLLPKYRGATPVAMTLLNGDLDTGITILFTVKKLDAGNIILQQQLSVPPQMSCGELTTWLFDKSAPLLIEAIKLLHQDSSFIGTVQDESQVSHCKKIQKEDGRINWEKSAQDILHQYLAYQPWPGVYCQLVDQRITITGIAPDIISLSGGKEPGFASFNKQLKALAIQTKDGSLAITHLKPEGSKNLSAQDFWNGIKNKDGGIKFT